MQKKKRIKDIGYKNVLIVLHEDIKDFGVSGLDLDGKSKEQQIELKKGQNVIQLHQDLVDDFIYALRKFADDKIKEVKILDFK
jgi:hypothetical protein